MIYIMLLVSFFTDVYNLLLMLIIALSHLTLTDIINIHLAGFSVCLFRPVSRVALHIFLKAHTC